MLKKVLIISAAIVVVLLAFLAYEGLFQKPQIVPAEEGGYLMMGMDHRGAYYKIGDVFEKVKEQVKQQGITDAKFAGVYFDDPGTTAEDSLKSFAAVIVNTSEDSLKLASLLGFRAIQINKGKAYVCDMESHDMVSQIIAITKAYSAFGTYFTAHEEESKELKFVYELYNDKGIRFVFQF